MITAVTYYQIATGQEQAALSAMRDYNRALSPQRGFISREILRSRVDPRRLLVLTSWESPEYLKLWVDNPKHSEIRRKLSSLWEGTPQSEYYDVVTKPEG